MKKLLPILLFSVPMLANAQTAKRDSVRHLSQLEVVANAPVKEASATLSRSNAPLNKMPLSINVLSMEELNKRNILDLKEATRFIPSAGFRQLYGAFLRFDVRGFTDQPVMVDGVRDERSAIDNSYPMSDLSDVESIEVLKGPASVLQGHSAVGGILNITRRKATDKRNVGLNLNYGSWNNLRSVLTLGGKLNKHWNGLAIVSYAKEDGWRSIGNKRFKVYGTLNGHWDSDEVNIRTSYNNDFYGTEAGLPAIFSTPIYNTKDGSLYLPAGQINPKYPRDARYNNESDFMYHRNFNMAFNWKHSFASWLNFNENLSLNADDIEYFSTEELSYPSSSQAIYPWYTENKDKSKTYYDLSKVKLTYPLGFEHLAKTIQNQVTLDAKFTTGYIKHNLTLGHDISFMRRNSFKGWGKGTTSGPGNGSTIDAFNPESAGPMYNRFTTVTPQKHFSQGVFLSNLWAFGDKISLMTALRYDWYKYSKGYKNKDKDAVEAIDGTNRFVDGAYYEDATSGALTYRVGLVYEPFKNISFYGSYSNIYKPYREFYNEKNTYVNNKGEVFDASNKTQVWEPMSGFQGEVGTRAKIADWLEVTASVFYIKKNNIVNRLKVTKGANGKSYVLGQVGSIVSQGGEISIKANPVKNLFLEGGYSYTDAVISKMVDNKWLKADEYEGNQLAFIPKHQAYILGSYELSKGWFKGLGTHVSTSYTGKRFRDTDNKTWFNAYTKVDLGLSYKFLDNHLRLGFDIYNLFDVETVQTEVYAQPIPNKPRNFMVSLRYSL